jgi:hypothetical protein
MQTGRKWILAPQEMFYFARPEVVRKNDHVAEHCLHEQQFFVSYITFSAGT